MKLARARLGIVERATLGWVQISDASLDKSDGFQQKLKRFRKEWLAMSGISVEVAGAHYQVFGIGGFHDHHSPGFKNSANLSQQFEQVVKLKMFNQMKSSYCLQTGFW